ncbi:F-box/kelch-repeat protein At3g06240-like [Cornus florida]|uniref:F-box/kelch-repeat protein At3g06240-like n=1 Tax=Cornus florida TaxID=4283 RepID=UPI0028A0B474|nr:F-box/kelch-repeat protein At3g06240-like [Cornus florida]
MPDELDGANVVLVDGGDVGAGDYKVVGFVSDVITLHSEVMVYTLGTNTWRCAGDAPFPKFGIEWCEVNLNGAVHWTIGTGCEFIYSFRIDEEQVCPIPPPPELRNTNTHSMRVGVLRNRLCIYNNCMDYLDMWLMKDYGVAESWTKFHILKTSIPLGLRKYYDIFPVTLWRDEEILFSCDNGLLVCYNHKKTSFSTPLTVYYRKGKVKGGMLRFNALTYRLNFFSLKDAVRRGVLRMVDVKSK